MSEETDAYTGKCIEFLNKTKAGRHAYTADLYHALQAAVSCGRDYVDAEELADEIMPSAGRAPRAGVAMGKEAFDLLGIVFDIEPVPVFKKGDLELTDGGGDRRQFRFTRKVRGGETVALVKVDGTVNG